MKTIINSITLTEDKDLFCGITTIHNNGDRFDDYETYSKEEIKSIVTPVQIELICEYMDKMELNELIDFLYIDTELIQIR